MLRTRKYRTHYSKGTMDPPPQQQYPVQQLLEDPQIAAHVANRGTVLQRAAKRQKKANKGKFTQDEIDSLRLALACDEAVSSRGIAWGWLRRKLQFAEEEWLREMQRLRDFLRRTVRSFFELATLRMQGARCCSCYIA